MTRNEYLNIHKWINRNYGKANRCESASCNGKSTAYSYALIKGKQHEKNRDNYMMLCNSCHQKYDFVEEKRQHLRKPWDENRRSAQRMRRLGKKASLETRKKMSILRSGSGNNMYGISITGSDHHFFGKHHTIETRIKLAKIKAKLLPSDVDDLRTLHHLGVKQTILSKEFGISKASVCRIVNHKRYTLCQ